MHLICAQSLAAGQEIGKIFLYEKYFSLPFDRYIVFAPWSKDSKNYDLWNDVLLILEPILNAQNIKIIQIGGPNERPLRNTYFIAGQTSIGQVAFLIKNSLLFFGADSFGQHIAGYYNKPLVDLISNNYAHVVRPYFGDKAKQIILEPKRQANELPSFSLQENPKSINTIHPEAIAKSICQLLSIDYNFQFEQIYCGRAYTSPMIISLGDSVVNPNQFGANNMIVDMTHDFNEDILAQQLRVCPCSIITNKPININLLIEAKRNNRVTELVYFIDNNHSTEFVQAVKEAGINYKLISRLPADILNHFKLDYFELGVIMTKPVINQGSVPELKELNITEFFYKSSKFYISKGMIYSSLADLEANKSISEFDTISPIIDIPTWWDDLDNYRIFRKIG